jgi:hypothetical protein
MQRETEMRRSGEKRSHVANPPYQKDIQRKRLERPKRSRSLEAYEDICIDTEGHSGEEETER